MPKPITEAMTQLRALTLGSQAIDHLLTGQPALETFDFTEVNTACNLLAGQRRARAQRRAGRHPDQATFDTAIVSLRKIYWRLHPSQLFSRLGRGGRQRPGLEAAAAALPGILIRVQAEYDRYWADFAESILAEAEGILEAAQA